MKKRHYLSAAILSLIAGGASQSDLMSKFQKEKEGARYTSYKDGVGIWTICGGLTHVDGKPVKAGQTIDPDRCEELDRQEQAKALDWVDAHITVPLSHVQKVGIASFCPWNIGPEKCFGSTFFKLINEGRQREACDEIVRWVNDGGKDCRKADSGCRGQVIRREQERELCLWGLRE